MTTISIIGNGNMARAIGALAVKGGNDVEVIGRDAAKSAAVVQSLGPNATVGGWKKTPSGEIVILAVLFQNAVEVVREFGDALDSTIIVDITNPFDDSGADLAVPHDSSVAKQIAEAGPASARVVKGFNTLFRHILESGQPVDVFLAGDDAAAKAAVSEFIESFGFRPRDTGDLRMAHWVEGAGLLTMGLARYGVGNFDFALSVQNVS